MIRHLKTPNKFYIYRSTEMYCISAAGPGCSAALHQPLSSAAASPPPGFTGSEAALTVPTMEPLRACMSGTDAHYCPVLALESMIINETFS